MTSYYCNDLALQLPNVDKVVDRTRHFLEILTTDGVELQLVIERTPMKADTTVAAIVEASVAERMRSLRGFEVASLNERTFADVTGVEAVVTYVEKERGPLSVFEFHCVVGETRIAYLCSTRVVNAAAVQQWMQTMLQELTLPDPEPE